MHAVRRAGWAEAAGRPACAGGSDIGAPLLAEGAPEPKSMRLGFVAGTIGEDKLHAFERLLFRATRGNMFLKFASVGTVVDPTTTEKVEKAVFVVFFAGERARSKILKVRPLLLIGGPISTHASACLAILVSSSVALAQWRAAPPWDMSCVGICTFHQRACRDAQPMRSQRRLCTRMNCALLYKHLKGGTSFSWKDD